MFEELFDQNDVVEGEELFDFYIKHGAQYNIMLIDSNAAKREHANVVTIIDQSDKVIKMIQL